MRPKVRWGFLLGTGKQLFIDSCFSCRWTSIAWRSKICTLERCLTMLLPVCLGLSAFHQNRSFASRLCNYSTTSQQWLWGLWTIFAKSATACDARVGPRNLKRARKAALVYCDFFWRLGLRWVTHNAITTGNPIYITCYHCMFCETKQQAIVALRTKKSIESGKKRFWGI